MTTPGVVVDANVIIALRDAGDVAHASAVSVLRALVGRQKLVHPLTLSEVLVHPARRGGRAEAMQQRAALESAGFVVLGGDGPSPEDIAVARAGGLRMPDAVVLASAVALAVPLVTFDRRVVAAAREASVQLIEATSSGDEA